MTSDTDHAKEDSGMTSTNPASTNPASTGPAGASHPVPAGHAAFSPRQLLWAASWGPAKAAPPALRWAANVVAVAGAVLVLLSALIHLKIYGNYEHISVIGPLFLAQGIVGILLALALGVFRRLGLILAGAAFLHRHRGRPAAQRELRPVRVQGQPARPLREIIADRGVRGRGRAADRGRAGAGLPAVAPAAGRRRRAGMTAPDLTAAPAREKSPASTAIPWTRPRVSDSVQRMGIPADRLPDETLLAGLGTGDAELSLAFVRRFQRVVFGVAVTVLGDPTTAEDVAQQTFERAWRHAQVFDTRRGSVRAWLSTIAHNLAVDVLRARTSTPVDPQDLPALLTAMTDTPERFAVAHDSAQGLRQALADLPPGQARAVAMAGIYGMTARQISEAEGIPLGTAKTRIRDGMEKLRSAYLREDVGDE